MWDKYFIQLTYLGQITPKLKSKKGQNGQESYIKMVGLTRGYIAKNGRIT